MKSIFFALLFLCVGCSNPPYRGKDVVGADEFVMDSYKIREGKFSILQMQGKELHDLSSQLLNEYKDTVQEGDILQVAVYHPTRLDIAVSVEQVGKAVGYQVINGQFKLPDLESIEIMGLSLEEAQAKIQEK